MCHVFLLFVSTWYFSLFAIMVSIILHSADVSDIGRYEDAFAASLFGLRMGIIVASFQLSGSVPQPMTYYIVRVVLVLSLLGAF